LSGADASILVDANDPLLETALRLSSTMVLQPARQRPLRALSSEADEIVCLETHRLFVAIGRYYVDFHQIEDDEVISILDRLGMPATSRNQP
jgi:predicted phosphoribosyltransferase